MREEDTVTPLELFFDLVLTQCTALMAKEPTWEGLAKGMLVLGVHRHIHTVITSRFGLAILLVALIPVAVEIPALATVAILAAALVVLIVEETHSYGEARARSRVRHGHSLGGADAR